MVISEETHNSLGEESHVLAHDECQVTRWDLFVVNHVSTDVLRVNNGISAVSEDILRSTVDSNWHLSDSLSWDEVSMTLFLLIKPVSIVWCPDLEASLANVLSIVEKLLHRCTVWLMTHVDCESILVIQVGLTCSEERKEKLTN